MTTTEAIQDLIAVSGSMERVAVETQTSFSAVRAWISGIRSPGRRSRSSLAEYARRLNRPARVVTALETRT